MVSDKKRCTVLKEASVHIMADYRNKNAKNLIIRLYGYCVSEGYELNWVGYHEDPNYYAFTAGDRKISFSPYEYERFDRMGACTSSTITYIFAGIPINADESPEIICLSTSFSEMRAKKLLKVANDFVKSTETDAKKRFSVPKAVAIQETATILLNPEWLRLLEILPFFS